MKKSLVRVVPLLFVICLVFACKKHASTGSITPSLSITATSQTSGSTAIHFPKVVVAVQMVDTLHSTLISGQYADTTKGSISIRVIGDTTGTFSGNAVLVTYVDGNGNSYNSSGASTDKVTITTFSKKAGGLVAGSFYLTVTGTPGTLMLAGQFTAGFLD